jgi:hypothetical protein
MVLKEYSLLQVGTFSSTEANWTVSELEAYAVVKALKALRNYTSGRPFKLLTDHKNLTFIHAATSPKIIRWRADTSQYPPIACHTSFQIR